MSNTKKEERATQTNGTKSNVAPVATQTTTTTANGQEVKNEAKTPIPKAVEKPKPPTVEEIEAKVLHYNEMVKHGKARDMWLRKSAELQHIKSDLEEPNNIHDFEGADYSICLKDKHGRETFIVSNESLISDFATFLNARIKVKVDELDILLTN